MDAALLHFVLLCSVLLDSYSKRLLQLDFLKFTKQFAAMADTVDIHILQV